MAEKADLSIIILNYNTRELLRECLWAVKATEKGNYEIKTIVIDNGSTDASASMVVDNFGWVTLIRSETNLGFAGGNNLALPKAKGKYLLFLNTDTRLPKKIFPEILNYLDKNPRVGALTVRLVLRGGKMDPDCHRGFPTPWASLTYFLGLERFFPKSRFFGGYHQFYLPLDKIHEIDSACGAFLIVRKEALKEIGGWDEDYFFYGEDIDLCYRLKKKKWKIIYYPKIEAVHYKGASSGLRGETRDIALADRQTRLRAARASIEAMKIFYNKFYRDKYPKLITTIVIAGIQIKGFLRLLFNYLKR